jgi:hypothetical protein
VTLQIILVFTLTCPKTFKGGSHKCIWQKFTLASCKCKNIYIYTQKQDKCKCKKFGRVSVNDLHLHWVCTGYWHLHAQHWFKLWTSFSSASYIYNKKAY